MIKQLKILSLIILLLAIPLATIWATGSDLIGFSNLNDSGGTSPPAYNIQYYQDQDLTKELPDPPYLTTGIYYLKIVTTKKLSVSPTLTINAQGTLNNVTRVAVVRLNDCIYRYLRVINKDNAATGSQQEIIQLSGTDINNDQFQNLNPLNEATNAAYLETQPPAVGSITLEGGGSITNNSTPYFTINSLGAAQMRLALSEAGLAIAPWVDYVSRYNGFDVSSGGNGTKTIWIEFKDKAGNIQTQHAHTPISYYNSKLAFDIEYYADAGLIHSLGANPVLEIGTYYLKIITNQNLTSNPIVNINAEGTNNDVTNGATIRVTSKVFYFVRTIHSDSAAIGDIKERITVDGITPSNADTASAYTVAAQYTLTVNSDGNGITIPTGNKIVNYGIKMDICALPIVGYHFNNWTQTGGTGKATFGNANSASTTVSVTGGNVTIKANFAVNTLTVNNDGNGSTNPSGTQSMKYRVNTNISASPNAGYHFCNWTQTGGTGKAIFGNANSANTTVSVTGGNVTIQANFAINQYTLTVTSNGNGSTAPTGNQTVYYGVNTSIDAIPNSGYCFMNWTKTSGTGTVTFSNPNIAKTTVAVTGGNATIQAHFAVIQYTLTVNNDGNGSTTPSGATIVNCGVNTTITAIPNTGYQFVNWTQTGGAGTAVFSNANSASSKVAVAGGNATIQAHFAMIQYTLTVNNDGNGSTTPSGAITVNYGVNTTITATPNPGYQFVNWTQTGGIGSATFGNTNAASTTVSVTGGKATIQAHFAMIQYTLTVNNDGNGSTTPSGATLVNYGVNTTITATPNTNYQFVNWTQTGGTGTANFGNANAAGTTVSVTGGNATIQAHFAVIQYTLTVNNDGNGSTTPSGATIVNCGVNTTITAIPNTGYQFVNWTQTGGAGTVVFSNANSASSKVAVAGGNATIQAHFAMIQYTLTVNNDGNGSTTPSGAITVNYGVNTTITATPNPGYQFVNWTQTGGIGSATFGNTNAASTTVSVTGGKATIQAHFAMIQYTLTVNNDGNGSTTPSGATLVNYGVNTTITTTPNTNYQFVNWTQTGGTGTANFGNANADGTTVSVTGGNATIQAHFAMIQYTLTVNNDGNGSTTPSGATIVTYGVNTIITAIPNTGYQFVNWTQTGGTGTTVFSSANSASSKVAVTGGNATIQAHFAVIQYTLTVNNDGNGSTTPSGATIVTYGVNTIITAIPNTGYQFVNWTQTGGTGTATFDNANAAGTTVSVTGGNATIQAHFAMIQYTLTVNNDGNGSTAPSGAISVNYGVNTTINAIPKTSYQFVNWTQTGGTGTATFGNANAAGTTVSVIGGNVTIQAHFAMIQYTLTVNNDGNGSTTPSGATSVNYGVNTNSTATPNPGYQFVNWTQTDGTGTVTFGNANAAGTTVSVTGGNATIQAHFAMIQYTLTVNNDGNGSTAPSGAISVNYGVNTTINAIPNTNYQFVNWTQTGGTGTANFGNANAAGTTVSVTGGNATIQAHFAMIQYTLTVNNDGNGSTTPSGATTVTYGVNTTIAATPNNGYQFVNWTQTGGTGTAIFGNANAAGTTVSVTGGNGAIQANFAPNQTPTPTVTSTPVPTPTATPEPITPMVAAGAFHSLALKSDGTVWAWGDNEDGQLGDGTYTSESTPVQVYGISNVKQIAAGGRLSVAVKTDGTVWAWGYNPCGLGNEMTTPSIYVFQVSGLTDIQEVVVGNPDAGSTTTGSMNCYVIALKNDGTVWSWGYNADGELGDGTTMNRTTPVQVKNLTGITSISTWYNHTLALKNDGTVWAWGNNQAGQLGTDNTTSSATPVQVFWITDVITISAGANFSIAVKSDGSVWAWGDNRNVTFGNGNITSSSIPTQSYNLEAENFASITSGYNCSYGLTSNGSGWSWGNNGNGQLGNGTIVNESAPVQISGLNGITSIAAGLNFALAIKNDGTIWTWGLNSNAQLGDGTTTNCLIPENGIRPSAETLIMTSNSQDGWTVTAGYWYMFNPNATYCFGSCPGISGALCFPTGKAMYINKIYVGPYWENAYYFARVVTIDFYYQGNLTYQWTFDPVALSNTYTTVPDFLCDQIVNNYGDGSAWGGDGGWQAQQGKQYYGYWAN